MRIFVIVFCLLTAGIQYSFAQQNNQKFSASEQEVVNLSKKKWDWMFDKNVDSLSLLFAEKSRLKMKI